MGSLWSHPGSEMSKHLPVGAGPFLLGPGRARRPVGRDIPPDNLLPLNLSQLGAGVFQAVHLEPDVVDAVVILAVGADVGVLVGLPPQGWSG